MSGHAPFQPHVEGLRGLAVLAVVFYHADILGVTAGYVGVDIFFVISGFLISWNLLADVSRGRFSILDFYEKRARRILPALIVMLAAVIATAWYFLTPADYKRLLQSAGATALFSSNIYFWQQAGGYFAPAATEQPLLHTWSLGIEEQFYILFPLLIWAIRRFAPGRTFQVIAVCALGSFVLAAVGAFERPAATFYLLPTRAWELFAGSLLAIRKPAPPGGKHSATWLPFLAAALLLGPLWLYPRGIAFPGLAALPPVLGAVLVIWLGPGGFASRALSWRPLRFVGRVSYSFYLWHFPLLALAAYISIGARQPLLQFGATGLAFVIATLSTFWLEEPMRRRSVRVRSSAVVTGGVAALLVTTCLSLALSTTAGLRGIYGRSMYLPPLPPRAGWCMSTAGTAWADPRCRVGPPGPPVFLLWGDSHALAAQAVFDSSAREAKVTGTLLGAFGCPPYASHAESVNPDCASFVEQGFRQFSPNRSIHTVIIVSYWAENFENSRLGDIVKLGAPPAAASGRGYEIAALNGAIHRFEALGWSVVLVGPIPEGEGDVPRMVYLRSRGLIGGQSIDATPEALARMGRARDDLVEAARGTHAQLVYPAALVCHGQICPLERGGVPLLNDDNHLSPAGAALLRPLADEILRSIASVRTR